MEMFPHTITIYNRYKEDGQEKTQRTILAGAFWNSIKGAVARKTGNAAADSVQLIIPFNVDTRKDRLMLAGSGEEYFLTKDESKYLINDERYKTYLRPKEFACLSDKTGKWTLAPGDVIILGASDYEPVKSISELRTLYDDVLVITSVDTRAFGGDMAHWEVSGK